MVIIAATIFGNTVFAEQIKLNLFFYKQEISVQLKEMCNEFTKRNKDITINTEMVPDESQTVLRVKIVSGESPDIIQLAAYNNVYEFAKTGWIEDLSNEEVIKKVIPTTLNSVTYKGNIYALPMDVAGIGIIYNKEIFKKYNLKTPATLKELQKVCDTLKKNNITPFAGLFKADWSLGHFLSLAHTSLIGDPNRVLTWINDMDDGKSSFGKPVDKDELFKLLDFYKANVDQNAAEMDWNEQKDVFAQGKAAMMVQGLWSYGAAKAANKDLDCGFIPFPVNNNVKKLKMFADVDSTFAIASSISTAKKIAAKKFLAWLATPEAIKIWVEKCNLVPTFKGANVKNMEQPFRDLMSYVDKKQTLPWEFQMYPVAVWKGSVRRGAQEYVFGKSTADQVMQDIDEEWKANMKK